MGHTFGAKAKAAIVAGSVALAVMPVTAFAAPQMQMGQPAEGQFGGEGMNQTGGQQPPAMPDGQQPAEGEQPPAMPDGQQPVEGEQPPALPDGQQPGDGQQPPAMPDGQQPANGQQPPVLPDGQQPAQSANGQQPPAGPMAQARTFIQKFIDLLGIKVDQTALDEFFNSFGAPQPGTQQSADTLGQA